MNSYFKPPYLGAAYYPEDWDVSHQDYDIAMMKKAGINVARIGEFAWSSMEPQPNEFNFKWLHDIVDKLYAAGIAVVMCTPTATPPRWLSVMYPDVTTEDSNGRKASHGGRRHCCSNNPHYQEYSARIVEKMGQEFGQHPAIIGWQIDNEIYAHGDGCFCEHCIEKFHKYLQEKYGTIENLNANWNLSLWSQKYDCFEDIPALRDAWHNPHIRLEWLTRQNISHVEFVHMQADILHKYTSAPIGTDTMPINGINYRRLNEKLDVVQFNHYQTPDNLWTAAMWFDYLRTMRPVPFWVTETQTCWTGSVEIQQSIKPEGFCRANSFMPLALGGEANMYWLWRTHWAGHEMAHGSVLDTSGRPQHIFGEVQDTAEMMKKSADFLNNTKVDTQVGFHYTSLNWNMKISQRIIWGTTPKLVEQFYKPISDAGLRPDLIDAEQSLDKYKLIFSPMMMTLEEGGLPERISQWVKDGGVWVVGPHSDIRTAIGTRYQDRNYGILEELTGVKWLYGIPDSENRIKTTWTGNGEPFSGQMWYDIFDESNDNSLVSISDGHSSINGKSCVVHRKIGKGHVIVLGTFPSYDDLRKIVSAAAKLSGIPCDTVEGQVLVSPRKGDAGEGVILVEYAGQNGAYNLDGGATDILTGKKHIGRIELKPYDILVLKK